MNKPQRELTKRQRPQRLTDKRKPRPALVLIGGFAAAILVGALLLWLPVSNVNREWMSFIDAFFVSASAVCVTGLTTVNVGGYFSIFGQIVLMLLIQVGGLGIMTAATLVFLIIRRKISYSERLMLQYALSSEHTGGVVRTTRSLLIMSFAVEGAGFAALLPGFIMRYGAIGVFKALFTAISAFCNAGFDVDAGGGSLSGFSGSVSVILSVSFLIIIGGLGFAVVKEIFTKKFAFKKFGLHTKLVLVTSGILTAASFVFFFAAEYDNPDSLGGMSFGEKLLNAFFLAVTPRTAGFSVAPPADLTGASRFFMLVLSFIGASPASTGGGIKTTTLAVLLIAVVSGLRDGQDLTVARRRISYRAVMRAISVVSFAFLFLLVGTAALLATESAANLGAAYNLENILFEAVSALGTVGLSLGITPRLSVGGKLIISALMFVGRLGPITLGLLLSKNAPAGKPLIVYQEENIMLG